MRTRHNKLLAKIALASYLGVAVLGFFHLLHMTHMNMPMEDCPFTQLLQSTGGGHTLLEHVQGTQVPLSALLSSFVLATLSLLFTFLFFRYQKIPECLHFSLYAHKERKREHFHLYQRLFSSGILNSKAF